MMFCRISLFLAFSSLAWSSPHFEYRPIGMRDYKNVTTSKPSTTETGSMSLITSANVLNLSSFCEAQKSSYISAYNPTGQLTTSTVTDYQGFDDTGDQTGSVVSQTYSTRTITFTKEGYVAYQNGGAKPPCCQTCRMSAGTIQFYWWPGLATATHSMTDSADSPMTSVAPNGFVFTSPSVYMAFSQLGAKNWCSTVGDVWYNTTIGFHPDEMTTINAYTTTYSSYRLTTEDGEVESEFITATGTRPPPSKLKYADLAQNCSSVSGYVYFPDDPQNDIMGSFEQDPCHPIIQLPDSLINMQQAWADNHCEAGEGAGAYDPPQALTAAEAEALPTLPGQAQPGSTSSPASVPVTSTFIAQPDTEPTSSADSSSSAAASETTSIIGVGPSSTSQPVFPSPVVASTAAALDTASRSDGPTLQSPDSQPSASELSVPSSTANDLTVTSMEEQTSSSQPVRPQMPQIESSQAGLSVPGNNNGPSEGVDATYTLVSPSTYTVIEETTMEGGQVSSATYTTEILPQAVETTGASPATYTVLQETTMANGEATVVSTVISMAIPPVSPGDAAMTSSVDIGNYIMSAIGQNETRSSTMPSGTSTSTSPWVNGHETPATYTGDAAIMKAGAGLMFCMLIMLAAI